MAYELDKEPPKEFRIFKRGWNSTQKGDFLFDDEAAKLVMDAYEKHGIERAIDLEHLSIDQESKAYDPDARGWFKLSVRDGELWAIDVRWTEDGDKRLRAATQRYISPFFAYGEKSRRVQSLHNVAIVATPATDEMPALVAASMRAGKKFATLSIEAVNMEALKKIFAALGLGEDASVEDALAAIKALSEGGEDGDEGDKGGALLSKMCKALGLADDATEDDVMKKLGADKGDDKDKDEEKAGELAALRSNNKQLQERLSTLEKESGESKVERLVNANPNKIPLHMEAFLKSQPIGVVTAYLKHAIEVPREAKQPPKQEGGGDNGGEIKLTKDEIRIAKLADQKPEDVLKFKKERAQKEKEARELQD